MTAELAKAEVERRFHRWWRRNYFAYVKDGQYKVGYDYRFWFRGRAWCTPFNFRYSLEFMACDLRPHKEKHG